MTKTRVSVVSYLNSRPFAYGLLNSEIYNSLEVSFDPPSVCAARLINDKVDIGLVPVAVIPEISNGEIISDYCIAAEGNVDSVLLLSNSPKEELTAIIQDGESRTSVMLARVLAQRHWNIQPTWIPESVAGFSEIAPNHGIIVIGDRALSMRRNFKYIYDLSYEWQQLTGLPFVFACWVANKKLDETILSSFNKALKYGLEHIPELIQQEHLSVAAGTYLQQTIKYRLDEKKQEAIRLFLSWIKLL